MNVDVLFVSFNRLRFTQESFGALLANTDWNSVNRLVLADDGSWDGTREWLEEARGSCPVPSRFLPSPFGGPVAAANLYLQRKSKPAAFAKIDNDTMVPPGWLTEMLRLLHEHPDVDLLGMAPLHGNPVPCPFPERTVKYAPWVDGNGVWRRRTFKGRELPVPAHANGRFGMTEWQGNQPEIIKAWAAPDLPVFQLDLLPIEPWLSQSEIYIQKGWQRRWPNWTFPPGASAYWDWWTEVGVT